MALISAFFNNSLTIVNDTTNTVVLAQPFKPTSTGEQESWSSEQEALDWWETQKPIYTHTEVVIETPPTE